MLPVIAVVVLVPALSFLTTQFILVPKLKSAAGAVTADPASEDAAPTKEGGKEGSKEGGAKAEGDKSKSAGSYAHTADFTDVIVNLAGSKGTRYLRSHFMLAGNDEHLENLVQKNMDQLKDIAISVLSAQTLDSLDAPGAQNAIRQELITQFNHTLHGEVVEQLYFSEFVVQ